MSHFTRVKTRMVHRQHLVAALRDLGYQPEEGDVKVRGWLGQRVRVQVKITPTPSSYDIGFQEKADGYEMVADWDGVKGVTRQSLLQKLTQRYAYQATRARLAEQGFDLVSEQAESDGRIHLVLRRMA